MRERGKLAGWLGGLGRHYEGGGVQHTYCGYSSSFVYGALGASAAIIGPKNKGPNQIYPKEMGILVESDKVLK